jgi:hypothetical protein
MMPGEIRDHREVSEWREGFAWIDPAFCSINGDELHWRKISPDDTRRSFRALERMRPYLYRAS